MIDTVFCIDQRFDANIFHWIFLMIAGLYHVKDYPKPIKFHLPMHGFDIQYETFELLKPDFEYIADISGYNIVRLYGADFKDKRPDIIHDYYYKFIREQLLVKNNLQINTKPFRNIYITRNNSHKLQCNTGCKRRQLVNEDEVYNILFKYGFEFVHLEKLSFREKIQLFQESRCIITPNGGALTFSAFAHEDTQLIEIHSNRLAFIDQYYNISKVLNLKIERYTNVEFISEPFDGPDPSYFIEFALKIHDLNDFDSFIQKYI